MKLELNLHIIYKPNGVSKAELSNELVKMAEYVADNASGDTAAEVLECTHEVKIIRARFTTDYAATLRAACLRLLQAAERYTEMDPLERNRAYPFELGELDAAKDLARDALNLGIPPDEQARRSKAGAA